MSHRSISPWAYTDLQNQAKSKVHKGQMAKETGCAGWFIAFMFYKS